MSQFTGSANQLKRYKWLDRDELNRLLDATVKARDAQAHTLFLVVSRCGLRVKEAVSLYAGDFDRVLGVLKVHTLKQKHDQIDEIECPPVVREALLRRIKEIGQGPDEPLLGYSHKRRAQEAFDKYATAAGIKMPKRGIHSLRHTLAMDAAQSGMEAIRIKSLLRHTSISSTDRYLHAIRVKDDRAKLSEGFALPDWNAPKRAAGGRKGAK